MIGDFFHRTYRFLRGRAAGGPRALAPTGRREDSSRPADPCFVCENLEPRLLLSVYTVTNVNDVGAGSFRQALVDARTLRLSKEEVLDRVKVFNPDIMGFMMTTYMFRDTLEWIRFLKKNTVSILTKVEF